MSTMKPVRVRFAPSPTGRLHLGGARTALYDYLIARQTGGQFVLRIARRSGGRSGNRTALYDYLIARQTGGQFVLRIEDTDQKRYVPESERELMSSLRWLGLEWDEGPDVGGPHGPYRQSERREIYQQVAEQLIRSGHAYYCFCSAERLEAVREQQKKSNQNTRYDGTCRRLDPVEAAARVKRGEPHVVRFKMPEEGSITLYEHLRGKIVVENRTLDDYIIVKSDGLAVYHLAAMVDDHLMGITHIIRGSEWLPTFPLHVHIMRALGWEEPVWIHLSVFLKPSGKGKMSKRESMDLAQEGYSVFINDLEHQGYLPEAVTNWIALMGWSYDDHTEFFTMQDLVEKFSLERLNPSPAAINFSKLDHFNGLHIRNLANDDLARRLKPFFLDAGYPVDDQRLLQIAPIVRERIVTLDEALPMAGFFFRDDVHPAPESLVGKNMTAAQSAEAVRKAIQVLEGLPEITHETAEQPLRNLAQELGLSAGQFFGILRSAITGQTVSPPLFESMAIIGKPTVLKRLSEADTQLIKMDASV